MRASKTKREDNAVNNEEYRNEEPRDGRLTTAALAAAGEPTASRKNLDLRARETEGQRKETGAGDASTMDGMGVAAAGAGAALAKDEQIFADERAKLDGQWDRGDSVSTEDLRLALRRYRAFFGRVLAV
jgi:hypothetical protein